MLSVRRWAQRMGIRRRPTQPIALEGNWDDVQAYVRAQSHTAERLIRRRRLNEYIRRNQPHTTVGRTRISRVDIDHDRLQWPVITSAPRPDEGFHSE